MIHPLIIAVWVADGIAVLLLFLAALRAEPVVRQWAPAAATRRQLQLERQLEAASLYGRLGQGAFFVGSIALLIAVTAALPEVVPGAMCGTGVVEAAKAEWALVLRGLALLALAGWTTVDRLDRSAPRAPLARLAATVLLPVAPIAGWSAWQTARALGRLDGQSAVDCCAALYEQRGPIPFRDQLTSVVDPVQGWTAGQAISGPFGIDGALFAVVAGLLVTAGLWLGRGPRRPLILVVFAVLTGGWILLATDVLVHHLVAYHYEVLAHHCPWCLFLPEHGGVGFLLFGTLAVAGFETMAALATVLAARFAPAIAMAAHRRSRRAAVVIAGAVATFSVVAAGPAVLWWVQYGVFLS